MIVRIVKMEFQEDKVTDFLQLFEERKERIRHFEGCKHLELWRQSGKSNIFFTYSHWNAESDLDHYRFSDFFKDTWQLTKALFAAKAEAWSVEQEVVME
ncbi:antibiotic biosynthesis monooxygenase [Taibaiella lutea]|uniref:Antibiotic biosynthesis monooxygenase n=1 Tax=Taibaiella lutea TaxID=2608001 RepID=A0A5M6CDQ2_9BACT|nr:antibiotic biosynthesis monooxygenase family protein [Taibaiella lutea]KAA5533314.1 antibiotic biosynthesis monooxygenase [Taibaiella lutea]